MFIFLVEFVELSGPPKLMRLDSENIISGNFRKYQKISGGRVYPWHIQYLYPGCIILG